MRDLANKGDSHAEPDAVKYHTIITAMLRRNEVAQAVEFLKHQLLDVEAGKRCSPDLSLCESVISACSSDVAHLHVGEALLKKLWTFHERGLIDFTPRFQSYKKVVWTRIDLKHPMRAFELLQEVEAKNISPKVSVLRNMYRAALAGCKTLPPPQQTILVTKIHCALKKIGSSRN